MPDQVERFTVPIQPRGKERGILLDPEGSFVRYSDYEKLEAELEKARYERYKAEAERDQARKQADQVDWPREILCCMNCGELLPDGYSSGGKCVDRFTEHAPQTFLVMPRKKRDEELREQLDQYQKVAGELAASLKSHMGQNCGGCSAKQALASLAALDSIFEEADGG